MLAASHALIGASIAKLVPNPYWGLPLNLILHFAADLTPHWDLHTRQANRSKAMIILWSLTDAGIGYLAGGWIFSGGVSWPYLGLMMLAAQLPDWLEAPYRIFDWHFPPFSSIKKLQSRLHRKLALPWGLIWQIIIVLGFVLIANP